MDVAEEVAKALIDMREKIVKLCEEKELIGRVVRDHEANKLRYGIAKSLVIEDGILKLHAGDRESYGHEPFDSSILLDKALFHEDSDGTVFITDTTPSRIEWKFFPNS